MTEPTRIAPAPHLAPELWNSIRIGTALFPAIAGRGYVKVKLKTVAEWEQQKPNGKDRGRSKFKGRKVASGTIDFHFTRHVYAPSRTLMLDIDPNGPNADKPWEVSHPEMSERGANRIVVKSMSEFGIAGHTYSFSAEVDAWWEPASAQVGGTKTPTKPEPVQYYQVKDPLVKPGAVVIALGEVQPKNGTGFDGPGAPGVDPGV